MRVVWDEINIKSVDRVKQIALLNVDRSYPISEGLCITKKSELPGEWRNFLTRYNKDELWRHYCKWNKTGKNKLIPLTWSRDKSRGYRAGEGLSLNGDRISVWEDEFWRWTVVVVVQHCECTSCPWIVHWKMVDVVNVMLYYIFYLKKIKIFSKIWLGITQEQEHGAGWEGTKGWSRQSKRKCEGSEMRAGTWPGCYEQLNV